MLGVVGRLGEAHGRGAVAVADERGALLVLAWRRERSGQSPRLLRQALQRLGLVFLLSDVPVSLLPSF